MNERERERKLKAERERESQRFHGLMKNRNVLLVHGSFNVKNVNYPYMDTIYDIERERNVKGEWSGLNY